METTIDDRKEFAKMMTVAATLYERDLDEMLIEVYFRALKEFSIDEVRNAFNRHIRASKWFPKPVELIQRINGDDESLEGRAIEQASLVWESIARVGHSQSVCFNDKVTAAVIDKIWGGWSKMACETKEHEQKWFIKDFIKYYEQFTRGGIKQEGALLGWHDLNNRKNGYSVDPDPVMIGYEPVEIAIEESTPVTIES